MDIFKKLLMMRQLKFEEGKIELLGQRVCITPRDIPVGMTEFILKHDTLIPEIYETIRTSFDKGWSKAVKNTYGFNSKEYFKWLITMSDFGGWGKSNLITLDENNITGTFRIDNSLIGEVYKS